MTAEIKACPFCGGVAEGHAVRGERNWARWREDYDEDQYIWHFYIECNVCGARSGEVFSPDEPWNGIFDAETQDAQSAIKKWNRRCEFD